VRLVLAGRPKFAFGGEIIVMGTPGGIRSRSGVDLDGQDVGLPGDYAYFTIPPDLRVTYG
jgi:hypothetical protein